MFTLLNCFTFNNNNFLNNIYDNPTIKTKEHLDLFGEYKYEIDKITNIFFQENILNSIENNVLFFVLMPLLLFTFIIIFSLSIEISSIRNNFLHFISFCFIITWIFIIFNLYFFNSIEYTNYYTIQNVLDTNTNYKDIISETQNFNLLNNKIEILHLVEDNSISLKFDKFQDFYSNTLFFLNQYNTTNAFWYINHIYFMLSELNNLISFFNEDFEKFFLLFNLGSSNNVGIDYIFNEITFNSFTIILILILLFFISFLFLGFIDKFFINENKNFEFSWLLWLFLLSSIFLFFSKTFIQIFICLECISFCSYILISLERYRKLSAISGVRYLVISAIPSVFLILGLIFMYKDFTSFDVDMIYNLFQSNLNIKYIDFFEILNTNSNQNMLTYNIYNNSEWINILNNKSFDNIFITNIFYFSLIDSFFTILNDVFINLKYLFEINYNFKEVFLSFNNFINLKEQVIIDHFIITKQLELLNLMSDYSLKNLNLEDFIISNEYKNYLQNSLNLNEKEINNLITDQLVNGFLSLGYGDLVFFNNFTELLYNIDSNLDCSTYLNEISFFKTTNNKFINNFLLIEFESNNILKKLIYNKILTNDFIYNINTNINLLSTDFFKFNENFHNLEIERLLNIKSLIQLNETKLTLDDYKTYLFNSHLIYTDIESFYSNELLNLWSLLNQKNLNLFKIETLSSKHLQNLLKESLTINFTLLNNINFENLFFTQNNNFLKLNNIFINFDDNFFNNNNIFLSELQINKLWNIKPYLHNIHEIYVNNIFDKFINSFEIKNISEKSVEISNWVSSFIFNNVYAFLNNNTSTELNWLLNKNLWLNEFKFIEESYYINLGLKKSTNILNNEFIFNNNSLSNHDHINIEKILITETLLNYNENLLYDYNPTIMLNYINYGESILLEEFFKNQTFIVSPLNGNIFETFNNLIPEIKNNTNIKYAIFPLFFLSTSIFDKNKESFLTNFNFNNFLTNNPLYQNLFNNSDLFFNESNFTFLSYFIISIILILVFLIINFSFKVTAAPFHIWAPTIYNEGTLSSVIFLSIFTKLVLFLFAINLFDVYLGFLRETWIYIFLILGLLSIIIGSFSAINEKFIKKFFVYSSMIDVGFLFLAFSFFPNLQAYGYIFLYLFVYNLSSLIIWFFISYIRNDTKFLTNLISILNKSWPIQFIFSLVIFSMAGIPPFAGFFIKLNILIGLESTERNALVFLVLLFTILSLFYYLRLIKIIQFDNISFDFFTNFVKPNVLFFASLFIFILIFFIFFVNQNLLVIFQEAFLTSKILDIQQLSVDLINFEGNNEDHWHSDLPKNDFGYWTYGRYLIFRQYWDEITFPNETYRWLKDASITLICLYISYLIWNWYNSKK